MKELKGKLKRTKFLKSRNGITLIALVITIIVLLILAGVTIATLTGDNSLLQKAGESKNTNEKGQIEEQIKLAYNDWKLRKETEENADLGNTVKTTLSSMYKDNLSVSTQQQGKIVNISVKNYNYTLTDDGTIEEGKIVYLDIADGNIDLYSNGYKQYTGNLQNINNSGVTTYTGNYLITGITTDYVVRVCSEGEYNITIKDLNIDVSNKNNLVPFLAGNISTGLNETIKIEGNNKLFSNNSAVLSWSNVKEGKDGSTLHIKGNGKLEVFCKGTNCIGGNNANNVVMKSGEIQGVKVGENYGSIIYANITINRWNDISKYWEKRSYSWKKHYYKWRKYNC